MKLYGLKNCDTCRKAAKDLTGAQFVDVRNDGVPTDLMAAAYERFGDRLVNTRSTTWRGLSETDRKRPALDLLAQHPTLMKRPLIVDGDKMWLGWDKTVQAALA